MMGSAALTDGASDVAVIKPAANRPPVNKEGLRNTHLENLENPEGRRRWLLEMSVMLSLQFLDGREL
jgi:hypothetical protein